MKRTLFWRWCWMETIAVLGFVSLALAGFASGVHGAPLFALIVILVIGVGVTSYAGTLYWRSDEELWLYGLPRERLVHDAEHVFYAVAICQVLGLIGAMLGYREISSAAALPNAGDAVHQLTLGLGNGLTATLAGVMVSLVIWIQHHVLVHRLERG